jgi:hypothetical protein
MDLILLNVPSKNPTEDPAGTRIPNYGAKRFYDENVTVL